MAAAPPTVDNANAPSAGTTVFVTVGTTKFDALVTALHSDAMLRLLRESYGVTGITCQLGKGATPPGCVLSSEGEGTYTLGGIEFETFRLRPSIANYLESADMVISHAGAVPRGRRPVQLAG